MVNIKKQKTQEEKDAITVEKKVLQGESKKAIEVFNKNTPLEDTKLPFQVSGDLSFVVQSVKISNVSGGALNITITVRTSQDITNDKGEFSQRTYVYFVAVDSKGKIIPDTGSWTTNDGWIMLTAETIYETNGHWNFDRVQNMGDFAFLRIIPEVEYQECK